MNRSQAGQSIKAAIVGCGDIAGGYDEKKKGDGIFSHAGAYRSVKNINICAAYDTDFQRLEKFCDFWCIENAKRTLKEILDGQYDIISVCTPDDTHEAIIEKILNAECTRYVWAEKPLTTSATSAERIIQLASSKKIGIWLSNQRRWEPHHQVLKERIRNEEFGKLIHITGYYVKGLTHIGCTLIDTFRYLFGDIRWVAAFPTDDKPDFRKDTSTMGALGFENGGTATMIGCDAGKYVYSIFEIDAIFSEGRIHLEENGDRIRIDEPFDYKYYSGFRELRGTENIQSEMKWAMKTGLGLLLEDNAKGKRSIGLAREGWKDLVVVDALKSSLSDGGERVDIHW